MLDQTEGPDKQTEKQRASLSALRNKKVVHHILHSPGDAVRNVILKIKKGLGSFVRTRKTSWVREKQHK